MTSERNEQNVHLRLLEYSRYPGPRYASQGPDSAEVFLRDLLRPRFFDAEGRNVHLIVDLDGTEGYTTAFLDGSFGELAREIGSSRVLKTIEFITNDEPSLKEEIEFYMKQLEL